MEMESPESSSSKSTSIPTTDTEIVQDSPVFNFISNLSPIQPVKATSATQGFPGLNSPPLVFTSPRLIPHSQATYLKRAKFSGLSAAKSSGQDEGCKNDAATDASQTLVTQMSTRLTECIEKASYSNNNVNEQIESPLGCSDQFFTDIVNMDSVDPDISADSSTNKSEHISQAPDAVNSTRQIDELHKDDASIYVSGLETDRKQEDSVSEKEPELPIENAPINHDQEEAENVEMEQAGLSDKSSYLTSGSVPIDKEFKGFGEVSETASAEQGAKKVQNNSKALQHRGIRRRCLQFEDAQRNVVCNQPVQTHLDSDGPTSQSLETPPTPINVNQAGAIQPVSHPRSKNSGPKIPKPSGIGLHLNSIINSVQPGSCAIINGKSSQRGTFSIRGKRSVPMINAHEFDNSNISASPDDDENESHATMAANISTSLSPHIVEPSVICNSLEGQPTPGNKRKCDPESDGGSLEFKSSSQKKRKKLSDSSDGDGCKRCNCKKTKCLKLYCDCFAAGIYCADACSCQGCFNRPQFEDIVLETRQQIETRNPLAFAPKVVQQIVEPPASSSGQDGTQYTPASARHKRGCNCKKSMCLKKYCECYQANVGCSDGCRCEGCKNVFGKKEGYGIIKHVLNEEDTTEQTDGSFIRIMAKSEIELYERNPHHLTPVTPALQSSNPENDASKAWLQSGKYFQSLESELPYEASYMMSPGSPGNSENNAILSETATEFIDRMSFDQVYGSVEMGLQYSVPNSHEWANNSSAGSVRWRGSPDTPMGGSKLIQNSEFDSDLSNLMLDDTPEILKDDPTPTNAVKVTSPNKKRVSPPHSRPLNFSSSSSTGVRTGRKFILKAVPSFPPLTPCINSKNVQTNDSQNCSGKK